MLSTTFAVEPEPPLKSRNDAMEEGRMLSLSAFSFFPPILTTSYLAGPSPWPSYRQPVLFFLSASLPHT